MNAGSISTRERQMLQLLWHRGPMSRSGLHEQTGLHPNLVGAAIAKLRRRQVVRQMHSARQGAGRPRTPLEIDPESRVAVGLSLAPGEIQAVKLTLRGEVLGRVQSLRVFRSKMLVNAARDLLRRMIERQTLVVGVSITGFIDPDAQTILFSSAAPSIGPLSLRPLFEVVASARQKSGKSQEAALPLVLENDMHALSARWLLTHRADPERDVLLVGIDDGRLGASVLINGRPNRGCVMAANELGHMRLSVATDRCYCGQVGCLERIFSGPFLRRLGIARGRSLADLISDPRNHRPALRRLSGLLATGLANAVNFVRPSRLVIASPFVRFPTFVRLLQPLVQHAMLPELQKRVRIDWWDEPCVQSASSAGWLGLAALYGDGWTEVATEKECAS